MRTPQWLETRGRRAGLTKPRGITRIEPWHKGALRRSTGRRRRRTTSPPSPPSAQPARRTEARKRRSLRRVGQRPHGPPPDAAPPNPSGSAAAGLRCARHSVGYGPRPRAVGYGPRLRVGGPFAGKRQAWPRIPEPWPCGRLKVMRRPSPPPSWRRSPLPLVRRLIARRSMGRGRWRTAIRAAPFGAVPNRSVASGAGSRNAARAPPPHCWRGSGDGRCRSPLLDRHSAGTVIPMPERATAGNGPPPETGTSTGDATPRRADAGTPPGPLRSG